MRIRCVRDSSSRMRSHRGRWERVNRRDAMLESIKIRTRPVLMTAFAVSVGMLPVAQGSAIGLERLAPLGAVAIGGLVEGTLMTLIFIPIGFILGGWGGEDLNIF